MTRPGRRDDDVPRLPRGKGLRLSTSQIIRIVMVAVALIALITLQKPCASSVGKFVTSFGNPDAAIRILDAGPDAGGEILRGDMTPAELAAAIERARERAGLTADAGLAADAAASADAR